MRPRESSTEQLSDQELVTNKQSVTSSATEGNNVYIDIDTENKENTALKEFTYRTLGTLSIVNADIIQVIRSFLDNSNIAMLRLTATPFYGEWTNGCVTSTEHQSILQRYKMDDITGKPIQQVGHIAPFPDPLIKQLAYYLMISAQFKDEIILLHAKNRVVKILFHSYLYNPFFRIMQKNQEIREWQAAQKKECMRNIEFLPEAIIELAALTSSIASAFQQENSEIKWFPRFYPTRFLEVKEPGKLAVLIFISMASLIIASNLVFSWKAQAINALHDYQTHYWQDKTLFDKSLSHDVGIQIITEALNDISCVTALSNASVSSLLGNFSQLMNVLGMGSAKNAVLAACAFWLDNCTMNATYESFHTQVTQLVSVGCHRHDFTEYDDQQLLKLVNSYRFPQIIIPIVGIAVYIGVIGTAAIVICITTILLSIFTIDRLMQKCGLSLAPLFDALVGPPYNFFNFLGTFFSGDIVKKARLLDDAHAATKFHHHEVVLNKIEFSSAFFKNMATAAQTDNTSSNGDSFNCRIY